VGNMTQIEALLIAHIILNITILLIIIIIEAKVSVVKETVYQLFDKVYFMKLVLDRVEKRVEVLSEKVAG
jgi:hypothetical protein